MKSVLLLLLFYSQLTDSMSRPQAAQSILYSRSPTFLQNSQSADTGPIRLIIIDEDEDTSRSYLNNTETRGAYNVETTVESGDDILEDRDEALPEEVLEGVAIYLANLN